MTAARGLPSLMARHPMVSVPRQVTIPLAFRSLSTQTGLALSPVETSQDITASSVDATVQAVDNAADVVLAAENVAEVANVLSSGFSLNPIHILMNVMDILHSSYGLPWWASIAATTVMIRTALLPFNLRLVRNTTILTLLRPEMERISADLKSAGTDTSKKERSAMEMRELWKKYNVNPLKNILTPFIMGPTFICFFLGIRRLAEGAPSFADGGLYWFSNLSAPDPYWALPLAAGATFLINVEQGFESGAKANDMARNMKWMMRGLAVAMPVFTASLPAGVFCYWITSNLYSLGQGMLIKVPAVRSLLSIPQKDATLQSLHGGNLSNVTTFANKPPPSPTSAAAEATPAAVSVSAKKLAAKRRKKKRSAQ